MLNEPVNAEISFFLVMNKNFVIKSSSKDFKGETKKFKAQDNREFSELLQYPLLMVASFQSLFRFSFIKKAFHENEEQFLAEQANSAVFTRDVSFAQTSSWQ